MTPTVTLAEGTATVFVAMDHATAECVGFHVAKSGNRFEALEPMRQGMRERFGGYAAQIAAGLSLRHDPGSAYLSEVFQDELRFLGIQSSPHFVRKPEGDGCAERFIPASACLCVSARRQAAPVAAGRRTLKENLLWVCLPTTGEGLPLALLAFQLP